MFFLSGLEGCPFYVEGYNLGYGMEKKGEGGRLVMKWDSIKWDEG